ncbi:hypothetical protein JOC34_003909 [Virgibacillus halotolerans]|uniref:hypothetical protein n=1 Tax=Virgibacillus halotolerans TaxID=1071053 RepID=UPI001961BCE4|nr:hypothetical protein [Virgibacillus halotolerans]MBM7601484.1 hypothetical protein [Virgibacillus halotolerans]
MKHMSFILFTIMLLQILTGCSLTEELFTEEEQSAVEVALKQDTGKGAIELVTPTITTADNEIEIKVSGINEDKITFISVANKTIFEDTIENDKVYTLDIGDIKDALRTDYKPKVQLLQTNNDKVSGDITTFKQIRYTVEQE